MDASLFYVFFLLRKWNNYGKKDGLTLKTLHTVEPFATNTIYCNYQIHEKLIFEIPFLCCKRATEADRVFNLQIRYTEKKAAAGEYMAGDRYFSIDRRDPRSRRPQFSNRSGSIFGVMSVKILTGSELVKP
jgi:hypothetical protein